MSSLSILETSNSLSTSSNQSLLNKKKINKIKKSLLNFAKEELTSFNTLKVKVYKNEIEDQNVENRIKIPQTFKSYFEDFKKNRDNINKIESGITTSLNVANSIPVDQVDSSDLVNSE